MGDAESLILVRAEGVAYGYGQGAQHLRPIDLTVRPGEFWLISGPSGCGKSTLARCLTGLIPHLYRGRMAGRVVVGDTDTDSALLWQLAERVGFVFQNPTAQMLCATVEDELLFGLETLGLDRPEMARRVDDALRQFDLARLRHRVPQTLSGGEQQKLALAAIMARRPRLLVLDEPLSMLDSTAALELVAHLQALTGAGIAVVVFEHRAEYLKSIPGLQLLSLAGNGRPSDIESLPPVPLQINPFVLQVRDLSVHLGGRPVLDRLSFSATSGEVLAIVGRNGSGKTTLVRSLASLQAYDGRVSADGEKPDFGLVYQNAELQLFNASVRDELLYRLPEPDMTWYDWLMPALGLKTYEETPPLLLSEGEKKRVALATVLMRRPRHGVLLDEPSLGQDAVHKDLLLRLARGLASAGQLVVMTTHDLALAARADRLMVLHEGRIIADGPAASVLLDTRAWQVAGLTVPPWVYAPEAQA